MSAVRETLELITSPGTRELVGKFVKSKKAERVLDASIALFEIGIVLIPLIKLGVDRGRDLLDAIRNTPEETNGERVALAKAKRLLHAA